mgnify:CR=1 FL=1
MRTKFLIVLLLWISSCSAWALTCSDVNGAQIVAADGTYLGFFGHPNATESILNSSVSFGSVSHPNSVLNVNGTYGSPASPKSVLYLSATMDTAPRLYKYGAHIAWVTASTDYFFKRYPGPGGRDRAVQEVRLSSLLSCSYTAQFALINQSVNPGSGAAQKPFSI